MAIKKNINYYLNLPWTYTIEKEENYYVIKVNELPGVCTDAESLDEGMELIKEAIQGAIKLYLKNGEEIPEPLNKELFKGKISYRTSIDRHYQIAKIAKMNRKSISKTIDELIDKSISRLKQLRR